jgi:hypothetical protein
MSFINKLSGKKSSNCYSIEIKEVETTKEKACCGTTNDQKSSCC